MYVGATVHKGWALRFVLPHCQTNSVVIWSDAAAAGLGSSSSQNPKHPITQITSTPPSHRLPVVYTLHLCISTLSSTYVFLLYSSHVLRYKESLDTTHPSTRWPHEQPMVGSRDCGSCPTLTALMGDSVSGRGIVFVWDSYKCYRSTPVLTISVLFSCNTIFKSGY